MTGPATVMNRPAAVMKGSAPAAATRPALLPHPHVFRTEESQP
ncbi:MULTISPECIES: hypothetical protein [Streptomyces]|nr:MULTISPECIES: hypothetical protein [unclassified Streptomyces]WTF65449.1 hypothetical protein OH791_32420 [Streptomyces anulatus]